MMVELEDPNDLPNFKGPHARMRCFLHILNLVAKSIISQFDTRKEKAKDQDGTEDEELVALTRTGA